MGTVKWWIGAIVLVVVLAVIMFRPLQIFFYRDLPYISLVGRALYILILAGVMCVYRIARGPTAADRIMAVDILGVLIVGFCAIVSIPTGRGWYIDIGIAWALQSFIGALAFSKYLEGKALDE